MQSVIADLRLMKLGKAAELLEEYGQETLTYYGFPDSHWIKLRTNNPLERIMREIRRRIPGWEVLSQPGRGQVETYCGDPMVHPKIHEHGTVIHGTK